MNTRWATFNQIADKGLINIIPSNQKWHKVLKGTGRNRQDVINNEQNKLLILLE